MHVTEQQVTIAAGLYEMRDTARQLLGVCYKQRMAEIGQQLKTTAEQNKQSVLEAAIEACRGASPLFAIYIVSAAVELLEPST